ncbi:MAG TPA: MBOAT family O-acyltransferase [Saprospiraceae bacterium]|nr:MBOAT family O-acyltransferase [Saprospiraceae bacterium]
MEIVSLKFTILSIVSIFVYYLLNHKYRAGFLAVLSCGFIATYSYILLIYIIIYAIFNYFIGLSLQGLKHKKAIFTFGIIINLTQLIILRYASFTIDPFIALFNGNVHVGNLARIILPIGISYFTLQGIGYLINLKMGWEKPEKQFIPFLLYIIFYPKFLSGPVERSNHFLPQLRSKIEFAEDNVVDGLKIAAFGLFKKAAIADQMALLINSTYSNLDNVDASTLWIVLVLQPLYLYFDFSGYTDMAIGLAKTFGVELLPNFNKPFLAHNVTTFWKRFHISLSSWFNDYVFRQLSFKYRKWGINASVFAMFVTWTLFGIWHGAGWNFMFLGVLQAIVLIYEFFTKAWRTKIGNNVPASLNIWSGRILTYLFYGISLVFFFSPDLSSVSVFFTSMFESDRTLLLLNPGQVLALVMSMVFGLIFVILEIIQNDFRKTDAAIMKFWNGFDRKHKFFRWIVYFLVVVIIFFSAAEGKAEFVYFRF